MSSGVTPRCSAKSRKYASSGGPQIWPGTIEFTRTLERPASDASVRAAASNVTEAIVPHSGHWVMEENPAATIKLTTDFLSR